MIVRPGYYDITIVIDRGINGKNARPG